MYAKIKGQLHLPSSLDVVQFSCCLESRTKPTPSLHRRRQVWNLQWQWLIFVAPFLHD